MVRRGRRSLGRKKETRAEWKRFLIYCEGKNTEKIYLQGLRRELRRQPVTIEVGPKHGEPLALVRAAAKHAGRAAADPDERFDQVWCVMDVEAPRPHAGLREALREAERAGINCAVSNPCFEVWLILHFQGTTGYLTSHQAQQRLASLLPGYDPGDGKSFDYETVRERRGEAMRHARLLHGSHAPGTGEWCAGNPCTTVGELLRALEP